MISLWMVIMLVTFMVTGFVWNTKDDAKSALWFFGTTIANIGIMMAILWFGGYFTDSPWYPEGKARRVAEDIGSCYGKTEYHQNKCLKEIRRKYDSCELQAGFAVYNGREPDLDCLQDR